MSPRMFRTPSSIVSSLLSCISSRCFSQFEFPLTAFVIITTGVFWEIRLFSEKRTSSEQNHLWAESCSCKRHTFFHSISLQLFSFCTLSSPLTFFTHDYPPCGISPVKSDFFLRNGLLVSRITYEPNRVRANVTRFFIQYHFSYSVFAHCPHHLRFSLMTTPHVEFHPSNPTFFWETDF